MIVLGVSALYHDSAAAIVKDGEIIAAAQEERFTRVKQDRSTPVHAIDYCLREAGNVKGGALDAVVYYDDPILTLERFLSNLAAVKNDAEDLIRNGADSIFGQKLWIEKLLRDHLHALGKEDRLYVARHHLSHAASAFYPSPFSSAAILTVDGVGEWNTTVLGVGRDEDIELIKCINYPHSLGLFYSAFTYFCGFRVNYGDYKLMGLAPYGEPKYRSLILENLIDVKEDGSFRLNLEYFDFQNGRAMTNERFAKLFGGSRRLSEAPLTIREMDIAASAQAVTQEIMLRLAKTVKKTTGEKNLVMAGGVTLNCTANGVLSREGLFDNIWIQPAAGDAGGALGAALAAYYSLSQKPRKISFPDSQKGSFLGPAFSNEEIEKYLTTINVPFNRMEDEALFEAIAEMLDRQFVIGLMEGRMEFGPRALGSRSIIGDPRSDKMQSRMNLQIKYRESFRPFAPAVLKERCEDYFDATLDSPYMMFCENVKIRRDETTDIRQKLTENQDLIRIIERNRSNIPAVTHVDYSARVQTVDEETNPFFYRLIKTFEKRTGCGVVINTSFNVRGEPIVCNPQDAYRCFMNTEIDALVMGNYLLLKSEQPVENKRRDRYEMD